MHCISEYPTNIKDLNLKFIPKMINKYKKLPSDIQIIQIVYFLVLLPQLLGQNILKNMFI